MQASYFSQIFSILLLRQNLSPLHSPTAASNHETISYFSFGIIFEELNCVHDLFAEKIVFWKWEDFA